MYLHQHPFAALVFLPQLFWFTLSTVKVQPQHSAAVGEKALRNDCEPPAEHFMAVRHSLASGWWT